MIKYTLPFPPSVNSAFGGGSSQKRFKSKQYKAWEKSCPPVMYFDMITDPVEVTYTLYVPDNRARDLSNYIKVPEDWLVANGVLKDDNHNIVRRVIIQLGGVDKGNPRVEIDIIIF